jgi:hypothetical protein
MKWGHRMKELQENLAASAVLILLIWSWSKTAQVVKSLLGYQGIAAIDQ